MKSLVRQLYCFSGSIFVCVVSSYPATAQIIPDVTLPNNSLVTTSQENLTIIDGGSRAGENLFHSFEQFSVAGGNTAFFNNAVDIQNIFSRVTGGSISNIDGMIKANGSADLFLINPAGIIFGANASLDIGGSFISSTANSIIFADGTEFSAVNTEAEPLLTINMPIGLGLGENPETIINRSFATDSSGEFFVGLEVPVGETLALIGGDVLIEGGIITAPEGSIELGSVSENQTVSLTEIETGWQFDYENVRAFQDIILDFALINTSGEKGGAVSLQGRNITLIEDSEVISDTNGVETGANIKVIASETVELSGDLTRVATNSFGNGTAGDLIVETEALIINQGAFMGTGGASDSSPGNLIIVASELVELSGTTSDNLLPSGLFTTVEDNASGEGKAIAIETQKLVIQEGAAISATTFGTGKSADININTSQSIELLGTSASETQVLPSGLFTQVESDATGDSGTLSVETTQLVLKDGAQIATTTFGEGQAGDLSIKASESIEIIGREASNLFSSGLFAQVEPNATGNGGILNVETAQLVVKDGAQISTNTFGSGKAGDLKVNVLDSVEIIGTGKSNLVPSGLLARVEEGATGDGGTLEINTRELTILEGAQISTAALQGKGGTLNINADLILASGTSALADNLSRSGIFVSAEPGATKKAGNLNLTANTLTVEKGARISADNFGTGTGSNTILNVNRLILREGGQIGAGSLLEPGTINNERGNGGELEVNATESLEITGNRTIGTTNVNSSLFTRAEGTGNAGNLTVTTPKLTVANSGNINVSATGTGEAGTLSINSQEIALDRGNLTAETRRGDRGNITIDSADTLLLRNESKITTNATEAATGGDITIDSELIALLENSDVKANAVRGRGGDISITSQGIFQDLDSEITAASQLGIDGTITLNTPDADSVQSIEELPSEVIDVAKLVAQNPCKQDRGSEFILTGKGGLAPSPSQTRSSNLSEVNLVEPAPFLADEQKQEANEAKRVENITKAIVEAHGWMINKRGNVELVAFKTDIDGSLPQPKNARICQQ